MAFINKNWLYLLGGLVLALLVWYFGQVVTYLLIAWVCSLLGQPIMRLFMDHIKIGRYRIGASWAALFTIFSFYGIFIGLLFLFVPTLVQQANNFAQIDYDALGNKLQAPFSIVDQEVHRLGILMPGESLSSKLQEAFFLGLSPLLSVTCWVLHFRLWVMWWLELLRLALYYTFFWRKKAFSHELCMH